MIYEQGIGNEAPQHPSHQIEGSVEQIASVRNERLLRKRLALALLHMG